MSQLRKDLFSCGMDQPILTKSPHHMLCGSTQTHTARPSRLVTRRGFTNIRSVNITNKKERFLADYFTTLLEAKWHWIFLLFCSAFLGSWASFGTIWWLIAWSRTFAGSEAICIEDVDSWTSAFLFSVETQTTIGYGGRQVTPECPEAVFCLLVQSLCGVTLSATLLGLIFAKLARPRHRSQTILFSEKAVIDLHDGKMCFMFRVADMRKNHLLSVSLKVYCFTFNSTKTEQFTVRQQELPISLGYENDDKNWEVQPFLYLPNTIVHIIDEESPLYDLSPENLSQTNMEIVAVLEGLVESTGLVTQAKASYLPSEILWGQRFTSLTVKSRQRGGFQVDMSTFDRTFQIPLSPRSAEQLRKSKKTNGKPRRANECSIWIPMERCVPSTN